MLTVGIVCFALCALTTLGLYHNTVGHDNDYGIGALFFLVGEAINILFWLALFFAIAFFMK